jgi:hypothetical protein
VIEALALVLIAVGVFLTFGLGVSLIVSGFLAIALSYVVNRKGGAA